MLGVLWELFCHTWQGPGTQHGFDVDLPCVSGRHACGFPVQALELAAWVRVPGLQLSSYVTLDHFYKMGSSEGHFEDDIGSECPEAPGG